MQQACSQQTGAARSRPALVGLVALLITLTAPVAPLRSVAAMPTGDDAIAATTTPAVARGRALFSGDLPLQARIAGHSDLLPTFVAACAACHGMAAVAAGSAPAAASASNPLAAPELRDGWLAKPLSRRNGPPAAYDAAALCRALRSGIDPVFVTLPARMPRFNLTDDDCSDLWDYLNSAR